MWSPRCFNVFWETPIQRGLPEALGVLRSFMKPQKRRGTETCLGDLYTNTYTHMHISVFLILIWGYSWISHKDNFAKPPLQMGFHKHHLGLDTKRTLRDFVHTNLHILVFSYWHGVLMKSHGGSFAQLTMQSEFTNTIGALIHICTFCLFSTDIGGGTQTPQIWSSYI